MTALPSASATTLAITADGALFELLTTPEGRADPYPRYAFLLANAPVHRSAFDVWVVSGFDHCQFVLRDPRFAKDESSIERSWGFTPEQLAQHAIVARDQRSMLMLNPPDHTRLRGLVAKAFTPRTVEALRPQIVRLTDGLIDQLEDSRAEGRPADVMAELAFPLPVTVIGELLGVPVADRAQFQNWVRAATATLELSITIEQLAAADRAGQAMEDYFHSLVAERRAHPQPDLLSELIAAEDQGEKLTEDELIATAILLFAAGFETTTNLIGNGLLALMRHPDQMQRLRADPSLLRSGVDELLRFDSPVQIDGRTALEDLEIDGHAVPKGATVLTLLGAANHDPRHFSYPERLDVGRDEGPPMSFGAGIHYCLGAALAKAEGQVVFGRLSERFRHIELCEPDPVYRDSLTLRGLAALPVAFSA